MIPLRSEPYRFDPGFEAIVVTMSCTRQKFYGRVGHELDPELLKDESAKLGMRAARQIATENGAGPSSAVLVLQRLRRWMSDGKVSFEQINALNDYFDETIDAGMPDEESVISELVPIIQQRIRDAAVQAGIDSFSKKGDLSKVVAMEQRAARVGAVAEASSTMRLTTLSQVSPERVSWFWQGRIAFGSLTLLDGDPGLGKSTLLTDLAARCSAGMSMPLGGPPPPPAGVLMLSAEDHTANTIKPRVMAAGGDPSRIHVWDAVADGVGGERPACLPDDLVLLESALGRAKARLLIIDPLFAFLSGRIDSHKDQDVKRALTTLAKLAERLRIAVVAVRHLNKSGNDRALYRGGGSIGVVGAARSALLVGRDPGDPDIRVLAPIKNNLSRLAPSLKFRIVTDMVGLEDVDVGRVEWLGECECTADALVAPPPPEKARALETARDFLLEFLRDGAKSATMVSAAALAENISERTLERARARLGVKATKAVGEHGAWQWSLPTPEEKKADGGVGGVGGHESESGHANGVSGVVAAHTNGTTRCTPPTPPTPPS
jgi:hypothetical protein